MKIAIIGAGWTGCHLANKLKINNDVIIYESNDVFSSTSFNNQNRLHLGFHYARSFNTRKLCLDTFNLFLNNYNKLTLNIKNNFYCIPDKKSIIDFNTYLSIFDNHIFDYKISNVKELKNIEGSILVKEKYIDPWKSKIFFKNELKDNIIYTKIDYKKLLNLKKENDLVINCTNNTFNPIKENCFYELCLMLKYKKKRNTSFNAITLVDGKLFSLYPYKNDIYTLSNVENTPIRIFENYNELLIYKNMFKINKKIINIFEDDINFFYKNFKKDFELDGYIVSSKTKNDNQSSNRNPIIVKDKNLINCYTGKIQGIYYIEKYILDLLNEL